MSRLTRLSQRDMTGPSGLTDMWLKAGVQVTLESGCMHDPMFCC